MSRTILLTGANGQLGRAFLEAAPPDVDVVPAFRAPPSDGRGVVLDLADADAPRAVVERVRPDWIVHAAALTGVDDCERDPALAHRLNAEATGRLASAAATVGARMVYVSTDYVFDGERGHYREDDATHAVQAYGASKLEGEHLARAALPDVVIARTSVVYGPHRPNFVTWLVRALREGQAVRLVEDQRVSPTLTLDLARMLLALVDADAEGVYHAAGATALSRVEMGEAIARAFDLSMDTVTPVKSDAFDWLAKRPRDTTLDVSKMKSVRAPMPFDAALAELKAHPGLAEVIA